VVELTEVNKVMVGYESDSSLSSLRVINDVISPAQQIRNVTVKYIVKKHIPDSTNGLYTSIGKIGTGSTIVIMTDEFNQTTYRKKTIGLEDINNGKLKNNYGSLLIDNLSVFIAGTELIEQNTLYDEGMHYQCIKNPTFSEGITGWNIFRDDVDVSWIKSRKSLKIKWVGTYDNKCIIYKHKLDSGIKYKLSINRKPGKLPVLVSNSIDLLDEVAALTESGDISIIGDGGFIYIGLNGRLTSRSYIELQSISLYRESIEITKKYKDVDIDTSKSITTKVNFGDKEVILKNIEGEIYG